MRGLVRRVAVLLVRGGNADEGFMRPSMYVGGKGREGELDRRENGWRGEGVVGKLWG